ncbi:transporter [Ruegeria atlantica]|uniref:transporter n=1 Tax=Ruegeria atlantica TaxID=81569 RepID=UPI0020C287DD|nr:transporter [Ruegeria atlantica]
MNLRLLRCSILAGIGALSGTAWAESQEEELAKLLANPVAALISVPFQLNHDQNLGADRNGSHWILNVQPVVPFHLADDWNLISRTILPIASIDGGLPDSGSETGLGDTVQSLFLSPKKPSAGGWIWGAGPVFLLPTSTDNSLGLGEWGAGVTGVALKQQGPWTYGGLTNHIWDIDSDTDINQTFLQPFISYTNSNAWTFTLNTESTYSWETDQWSVPINGVVTKVPNSGINLSAWAGGYATGPTAPIVGPTVGA